MLRRILNLMPEGAVAAPPAPSSSAAPATPAPAAPSAEPSNDLLGDFDKEMSTALKPEPKEPKKPDAKTPEKPPDKKPDAKAPEKPADKPADKKPDAAPVEEKVESMGIKQLRQRGDKAVEEAKGLRQQLADREAKLAEYEKKGKDTEGITKRIAELEKQLEDKDKRLYALNVAESKEFKEKFVQPYMDAAEDYKAEVERMEVSVTDAEGNVTSTRPANWENDFAQIFHLNKTSVTKANQMAKQIFKDDAPTVMGMVQDLYRKDKARAKALGDMQTNADSMRQKEIADAKSQQEWISKSWRDINTDLAEKTPEYFQPDPQDKQRAELFTKSLALVDARHNGKALTPIQQVTLDAQTRLRAAAFPVLKYDVAKRDNRIAELEAEIAELRGSAPGDTQHPTGDAPAAKSKSVLEELNEVLAD